MKREKKIGLGKVNLDIHRVTKVVIRVEEYPASGFKTLEFWVSSEELGRDGLVLKCFCDKGFQIRQINDSLVERVIECSPRTVSPMEESEEEK